MKSSFFDRFPAPPNIFIYTNKFNYIVIFSFSLVFYLLEILVVLPALADHYEMGLWIQYTHVYAASFLFFNVFGNLMMFQLIDTTLSGIKDCLKSSVVTNPSGDCSYCEACDIYRPKDAWHCKVCNECIQGRSYHCFLFGRCIGSLNYRFYLVSLIQMLISLAYAGYYNVYYAILSLEDEEPIYSAVLRILMPGFDMVRPRKYALYATFLMTLNLGLLLWVGVLLPYRFYDLIKGVNMYEIKNKTPEERDSWKDNLLTIFGQRWYVVFLCPFARSPSYKRKVI